MDLVQISLFPILGRLALGGFRDQGEYIICNVSCESGPGSASSTRPQCTEGVAAEFEKKRCGPVGVFSRREFRVLQPYRGPSLQLRQNNDFVVRPRVVGLLALVFSRTKTRQSRCDERRGILCRNLCALLASLLRTCRVLRPEGLNSTLCRDQRGPLSPWGHRALYRRYKFSTLWIRF